MKREFLKGLGLTDEAIDSVMAENGRDIERQKEKLEAQKAEMETLQHTAQAAEEKVSAMQFEHALDGALQKAKAKNVTAVKALLNRDELKMAEDGSVTGLAGQLDGIRAENGFLFENETPLPSIVGHTPGTARKKDVRKMTYTELCKFQAEHPGMEI